MMLSRMTTTAQRNQIIKGVVLKLFIGRDALPVDMMNMQVVGRAAMLAGVVVALKRCSAIASKVSIVSSFVSVALKPFLVRFQPLMYPRNVVFRLTLTAPMLWARVVDEIFTTVGTHQNGAFRRSTSLLSESSKMRPVVLSVKSLFAGFADLLSRAGWLVGCAARNARPLLEAFTSLPMRGQGAMVTPLQVRGGFDDNGSTIMAGQFAIGFHRFNSNQIPSQIIA